VKYEVMTDYGDLLVLSIHGRVILVSRDMSEITAKMSENYEMHMNKAKKTIEKANVTTDNMTTEERPSYKQIKPTIKTKEPDEGSLGKLFSL
jgi:hypothetical protein